MKQLNRIELSVRKINAKYLRLEEYVVKLEEKVKKQRKRSFEVNIRNDSLLKGLTAIIAGLSQELKTVGMFHFI